MKRNKKFNKLGTSSSRGIHEALRDTSYGGRFFIYFVVGILITLLLVVDYVLITELGNFFDANEIFKNLAQGDLYVTQISVTFIVVSLSSVFSGDSPKVYWTDITTYQLINPLCTNFIALTAYLFSTLLLSTVFILMRSEYLLISFGLSIIVMSILSFRMVGAYFGRSSIKKKLQAAYLSEKNEGVHESRKAKILENTLQSITANESELLKENFELLLLDEDYDSYLRIVKFCIDANPAMLENVVVSFPEVCESEKVYKQYISFIRELIKKGASMWIYTSLMKAVTNEYQKQVIYALESWIKTHKEYFAKLNKKVQRGLVMETEAEVQLVSDLMDDDRVSAVFSSPDNIIFDCIANNYEGLRLYLDIRQKMIYAIYNTLKEFWADAPTFVEGGIGRFFQVSVGMRADIERYVLTELTTNAKALYDLETLIFSVYGSCSNEFGGDGVRVNELTKRGVNDKRGMTWSYMGEHRTEIVREVLHNIEFVYPERVYSVFETGTINLPRHNS